MAWTDDNIERLKTYWARGLSCSQIAVLLGSGISRSAVIGKAYRLKLPSHADRADKRNSIATRKKRRNKRKAPLAKPSLTPIQRIIELSRNEPVTQHEDVCIPPDERQTLLVRDELGRLTANDRLTPDCCRWPIGDPLQPEFHFCARPIVPGSSYCERHVRRAFNVPVVRKRLAPSETPVPRAEPTKKLEVA